MLKKILVGIQWRALVYCAIGLWIVLCASDFNYDKYGELMLLKDKVFLPTAITYQVAIEEDDKLSIEYFIEKEHKSWNITRKLRILMIFFAAFMSTWSILFIFWIQGYVRRKPEQLMKLASLTKELNTVEKISKNSSVQVSNPPYFASTVLHYEKKEKLTCQEWFLMIKSSLNTVSCTFEEEKKEHEVIYKYLEKRKNKMDDYRIDKHDEHTIKYLATEPPEYQYKPQFPLLHYINLNRSIHLRSTLLFQRYTIDVLNSFSSLSIKYMFHSSSLMYLTKNNDSFDCKDMDEMNVNKFKILVWSQKKTKKEQLMPKYYGKTNGYIISSSPAFQQFLANFMNIKCTQPSYV